MNFISVTPVVLVYLDHYANCIGQFLYARLVMYNLSEQWNQREFFAEMESDLLPKGITEA